ncbi:MAG: hypothetical protein EP338_02965 [Bacteroidetes bacterium]|nr:MAG: hypothetical protein EP338_02965 [Bacteroidota bacterium]
MTGRQVIGALAVGILLLSVSSCGINSSVMFKTPKGGEYQYDSIPMKPKSEYQIGPDDRFRMFISTNKGANVIREMSGIAGANGMQTDVIEPKLEYLVEPDGQANLPIIGRVKLAGLTVGQAEDTISYLYDNKGGYIDGFVQIVLTNKRIIVFPGESGTAKVVPLLNENTTLMEALAAAGGIANRGKANTVKLMRMEEGERKVYLLDMSTIEGLRYADLLVQANDYIYVEPHERYGREILTQVAPIVTLLTSTTLVILAVLSF